MRVVDSRAPILVVDDDDPTKRLVDALLQRHGYSTVLASNGSEAIELLRTRTFAAIILDMMMPTVSGIDVIAFLAQQSLSIPVVICTAAPPTKVNGLDATYVKAVIRKPFDIDDFIATVKAVAGGAPPQPRVLIVDDNVRDRYLLRTFVGSVDALEAETGEAALELIHQKRPDIVLLDLILPGVQGEDVLRILRERAGTTSVPVVVVTSKILSDDERRELLGYAAAVIYKGDLSRQTLRDAMVSAMTPPQ
jgi:CheY-like chemotaxis protein